MFSVYKNYFLNHVCWCQMVLRNTEKIHLSLFSSGSVCGCSWQPKLLLRVIYNICLKVKLIFSIVSTLWKADRAEIERTREEKTICQICQEKKIKCSFKDSSSAMHEVNIHNNILIAPLASNLAVLRAGREFRCSKVNLVRKLLDFNEHKNFQ